MTKSTQLVTAAHIASIVGAAHPLQVNTDKIAEAVNTHPSRVRRLVSKLVKAGLLKSNRGSCGGIHLAKEADAITLADIYDAVQEQPVLSLGIHDNCCEPEGRCNLNETFENLYGNVEASIRTQLSQIPLAKVLNGAEPIELKSK